MKLTFRHYLKYLRIKGIQNISKEIGEMLELAENLPEHQLNSLLINRAYDEETKKSMRQIKKVLKNHSKITS